MHKLLLSQLLGFDDQRIAKCKFRFNKSGDGQTAFEKYLENEDTSEFDKMSMNCNRKKMFDVGDTLIGLAKISYDKWLFVKVYLITSDIYSGKPGPSYER